MGKCDYLLSKDLPGGRVEVPEGSEQKRYYKYYLEPFEDISQELKNKISKGNFKKGLGLEVKDRKRLQEIEMFSNDPGYYLLRDGGVLSYAVIKTPDITSEMSKWWSGWHAIDSLRYAIWDCEDHYDVQVIENKERLLDESLPVAERLWGTKHAIIESFIGDKPSPVSMKFLCPCDCGYDKALDGTDRMLSIICAESCLNGKVPVFATEMLVKGADGINEVRCCFWIGYQMKEVFVCAT